jgi:probable rRNA maturation factor
MDLPRRRRTPAITVHRGLVGGRIPTGLICRTLRRAARAEGATGDADVIVVDDLSMHALNRRFRKRNRPTDVLAFPLSGPFSPLVGRERLGEIYCNYDHARRWRNEHGGTITEELVRLVVHGYLHLLGYDHHTAADRRRMACVEECYLRGTGMITVRHRRAAAVRSRQAR